MNISHTVTIDRHGTIAAAIHITEATGTDERLMHSATDIRLLYRELNDEKRFEELLQQDHARLQELYGKEVVKEQLDEVFADIRRAREKSIRTAREEGQAGKSAGSRSVRFR